MSEIRLYVDEDASEGAVIVALRARAIDVVTTAETGHLGAADADQLAWATEQERVLYTFNVRDFARLHGEYLSKGLRHCGIVVLPDQHCSTLRIPPSPDSHSVPFRTPVPAHSG